LGEICLVLGGTKTGKNRYAEKRASDKEEKGGKILYLATAEALDTEMKSRIEKHQSERPETWNTIEEPINIFQKIKENGNNYDLILLDCLTLWVTNKLAKAGENYNREEVIKTIVNDCISFVKKAKTLKCDLVIISNQVETGLISPYPLGRIFQDIAGLAHQGIANIAKDVILVQAGIPVALKGEL